MIIHNSAHENLLKAIYKIFNKYFIRIIIGFFISLFIFNLVLVKVFEVDILSIAKQAFEKDVSVKHLPSVDLLHVDIKKKSFDKLIKARENALKKKYITQEEKFPIKGILNYKGNEYLANLRFKGDLTDHLSSNLWSFRIKLKDSKVIKGMNEFSIQRPEARNNLGEFVFLKAIESQGLLSHKYELIRVALNGKASALYALEEHFGTEMIERQERREGPIFKYDESLWWKSRYSFEKLNLNYVLPGAGDFYSLDIDIFSRKKFEKNPKLKKLVNIGANLLEGFNSNELSASEVFDIDAMAKYLALVDIFGAVHGVSTNQLRFYLNPITAKLEIVPYDANAVVKIIKPIGTITREDYISWKGGIHSLFVDKLFKDLQMRKRYYSYLRKFSNKTFFKKLKEEIIKSTQKERLLILSENNSRDFNWRIVDYNLSIIDKYLYPERTLKVYLDSNELELANLHATPVKILRIIDKKGSEEINLELPPRFAGNSLVYNLEKLKREDFVDPVIEYQVAYGENIFTEKIKQRKRYNDKIEKLPTKIKEFPSNKYIVFNKETKEFIFKKGVVQLTESIVFPPNSKVIIQDSTSIDLLSGAKIISYSPIHMRGTKKSPILIYSSDKKGEGIAVLNANEKSIFKHVSFFNLSNLKSKEEEWTLSGSVNFYHSEVDIDNCLFESNIKGDDFLNIINSRFIINNSNFKNTVFDALDVDYGKGKVLNTKFLSSGNDAADFSGSSVSLDNVEFLKTKDKAVSAGENSFIVLKEVKIEDYGIGIASKDLSRVIGESIKILSGTYPIVAFQKKQQYGPAQVILNKLEADFSNKNYLIEEGSILEVNKIVVNGTEKNLRNKFY